MDTLRADLHVLLTHELVQVATREHARLVDAMMAWRQLCDLVCAAGTVSGRSMNFTVTRVLLHTVDTTGMVCMKSQLRSCVAVRTNGGSYSAYATQTTSDLESTYRQLTRPLAAASVSRGEFVEQWHAALRVARSVRMFVALVSLHAASMPIAAEIAQMIDDDFVCDDYS